MPVVYVAYKWMDVSYVHGVSRMFTTHIYTYMYSFLCVLLRALSPRETLFRCHLAIYRSFDCFFLVGQCWFQLFGLYVLCPFGIIVSLCVKSWGMGWDM